MFARSYPMFGIDYLQVKNSICQIRKYSWQIIVVKSILLNLQDNSKKI